MADRTPPSAVDQLPSRDLNEVLEEHVAAVDRRLKQRGGYTHADADLRRIKLLADDVRRLAPAIGIAGCLHDYKPDSERLTLLVVDQHGNRSVLKAGPRGAEALASESDPKTPTEALHLQLLAEHGVAVPKVLGSGYLRAGEDASSWLRLEFIEGKVLGVEQPLVVAEPGLPWAEVERRVAEMVPILQKAHVPYDHEHPFPGAVSFGDEVGRYFKGHCVPKAVEIGLIDQREADAWIRDFDSLTKRSPGDVLLLGDPTEVNTLVSGGQMVVLDPVTTWGRRELDYARWCNRLLRHGGHSPFLAAELIQYLVDKDPGLDPGVLCAAMANEFRTDAWHEATEPKPWHREADQGRSYGEQLVAAAGELAFAARAIGFGTSIEKAGPKLLDLERRMKELRGGAELTAEHVHGL